MVEQPWDAVETASRIDSGEVSAREVVEESIRRIEKHDPDLNMMVATRFEEALAEVDRGLPDGPLRGVPIVIKDLGADVAGLPSTKGSRLFAEGVAARDSTVVARYRAAGMVVLGTTNSPELGKNASTEPVLYGPTRNPWNIDRSPGGSSGGSAAAVSAGLVPVAHGNDGGGSIRIPAAMCGLFGLKPSRGRVPSWPYPSALSAPVSVHHALTTTVRDSAVLLDVVAGHVPGDAYGAPTPNRSFAEHLEVRAPRLRIGWSTAALGGVPVHPDCAAAVQRAAELCAELGHDVAEVTLNHDPALVMAASGTIMAVELVAAVEQRLRELGRELRDDDLEPFTHGLLQHGRTITGAQTAEALRAAQEVGWQVGRLFADHDVLLLPTLAQPVPPLGLLDTTRPETLYEHGTTYSIFTSLFNVTGQPAMSVPFGTDTAGLPVGVQFAADLGEEGRLLQLAAQLEQAAPWPRNAPGYAQE
ncbi:amidase [Blastococcus sp. BMG 814]|uniref:Amidase n=1 Tax=Blastococcus carthaginiensis TaxID=3050034 RepID=A0ABT9I8E9_9ACTN|nr:amidase [Blastococcus carthaginiensis]MDP5181850.1 amidase [Blastococcus carthaginiensis]